MTSPKRLSLVVAFITLTSAVAPLAGCKHDPQRIERIQTENPGSHCKYGGLRVAAGFDEDEDLYLDDEEIDETLTKYTCAVLAEGKVAKILLTRIDPGATCPKGGVLVQAGLDKNDSGQLDPNEIESTSTICNGNDGTNGTNGTNGKDSLIKLSDIPSGSPECFFGGTRVEAGLDLNLDQILQPSEVRTTTYVCSVRVIENVIVESSILMPGQVQACPQGGVRMTAGVDQNGDKRLQPGEVQATSDICNLIQTVPGKTSLMRTAPATAQQCPTGGYVMQSGVDNNSNGALEAGEITNTNVVCNGANGLNSAVRTTPIGPGANCPTGGVRVESGLDVNSNNQLDPNEITNTGYVCHGLEGLPGFTSLMRQSPDQQFCLFGGIKLESGLDLNSNGILSFDEVDYTSYVCNGYDGYTTRTNASYYNGNQCAWGGVRYDMGLDVNVNGKLDPNEVTDSRYVCNGADGWIVDADDPVDAGVCPFGGIKVEVGPDLDFDGQLFGAEVQQVSYICAP